MDDGWTTGGRRVDDGCDECSMLNARAGRRIQNALNRRRSARKNEMKNEDDKMKITNNSQLTVHSILDTGNKIALRHRPYQRSTPKPLNAHPARQSNS